MCASQRESASRRARRAPSIVASTMCCPLGCADFALTDALPASAEPHLVKKKW